MSKHWQESLLEFRRDTDPLTHEYPYARGIVVYQYGGSAEDCVAKARTQFNLGPEWKLINWSAP